MSEWTIVKKEKKPKKEKEVEIKDRIIYKRDELINIIKTVLEPYNPYGLFLYGSYAYNRASASSDVDLLVIWEKRIPDSCSNIKSALVEKLGKHVDFVNMIYAGKIVNEKNQSNSNFLENVYEDCIPIINDKCCILISHLIGKQVYKK